MVINLHFGFGHAINIFIGKKRAFYSSGSKRHEKKKLGQYGFSRYVRLPRIASSSKSCNKFHLWRGQQEKVLIKNFNEILNSFELSNEAFFRAELFPSRKLIPQLCPA